MRTFSRLFLLFLTLTMAFGCAHEQEPYKAKLDVNLPSPMELSFDRYEEVLFNIDTARFQETLLSLQHDYYPFLAGDLSNPDAVKYLKDFAIDTFSVTLYRKVKNTYPDLKAVEKTIQSVYQHFNYYYPDIQLPKKVFTCVSGVNPDIPSMMISDNALVISLDWYLDRDEVYDRIGMPKYRSERTGKSNIGTDLAEVLVDTYLPDRHRQTTVLEEMIHEGKRLFFVEAMNPNVDDGVLLGYAPEQLQWAVANEGDLWADIVGNQRLYATDYEWFRTFFADGPFTNEYSYDAPARLGEFLGLRIVRSYMNSHDVTLQALMRDHDLQGLFQESGYKPKK